MTRRAVMIFALTLSTLAWASAALNTPRVSAGLYCSQLKGCAGDAGCANSGSASGCFIICGDDSRVNCGYASGGGDDEMLIE
jgi:hypothetical protein